MWLMATAICPDRSFEALALIFQVCISYKILIKNDHFHWEKIALATASYASYIKHLIHMVF